MTQDYNALTWFTPGRTYKTRDGLPAFVERIDLEANYSLRGYIIISAGRVSSSWTLKGEWVGQTTSAKDLVGAWGGDDDFLVPTDMPITTNNQPTDEGKTKMNYSTAVMLFNTNIRAIKVTYEPDAPGSKKERYTFKTLDDTIKVGDFVVIPTDTRHNMTIAKVEEVDIEIDFDSNIQLKWIISRVDTEEAARITAEETTWIDTLKASEKRRKREEIKKNVSEMYSDVAAANLAIAHLGEVSDINTTAAKDETA